MKHKVCSMQDFKALDEQQGVFEAIVAVFGNIDRVGDMVMPGAFKGTLARWKEKGRPIPVIFAHEWENLDAHVGEVLEAKEVEQGLYVKAQLDLEEDFARRVWKKMKKGTLAEFSFSYDVLKSKLVPVDDSKSSDATNGRRFINELHELELFEVGPCLVGMNPDTQLIDVKAALPSHSTATTDAAWDGPANEARARSGESEAYYRRIYAWRDPDGDPAVKSTYKFPHHMVGEGGEPGAANIRACQAGIGALNGGRGGTTIPDGDRRGVYNHLAAHLRSADVEPPDLKTVRKEYDWQEIHDMAVSLGAKCAGHNDGNPKGADQGKAADHGTLRNLALSTEAIDGKLKKYRKYGG